MSKSSWFINKDKIIIVRRDLAEKVGLDEAIVLSQLNYWLENDNAGVFFDGYKWIYNSYEEWCHGNEKQEPNFPFWSTHTVQRIFLNLEKMGLVISRQLDSARWNRKKYYRIDYEKMDLL